MDGYLDQQVPYTLANVRMEKVAVCRCFLFFFFFPVSRLHEFVCAAAAEN